LYKKFLDVIEIPPIGHIDERSQILCTFLAFYESKMKRDRVLKDQCFDENRLKEESDTWIEKSRVGCGRIMTNGSNEEKNIKN
jgi:hypothetical protein